MSNSSNLGIRNRDVWGKALMMALFSILLLVTIYGCATSGMSMPSANQLISSGLAESAEAHDALKRGRAIAITACSECHVQYFPQEFAPEEWPELSKDMGKRASLTIKQIDDLTLYMVTASQTASVETAP